MDEAAPPDFDELRERIARAHDRGRPVAVHCVTRTELVLAAAAFRAAGGHPQDRIEHASVAPPDALEAFEGLPITLVTQPGFIRERGDAYRTEVGETDRPWLYRCGSVSHIRIGGSTDAPFGDPDPWLAMQAAVDRRTLDGHVLGPDERVDPERALALFTTPFDDPGGTPRAVEVGAPADLCLLDRPWSRARDHLASDMVRTVLSRESERRCATAFSDSDISGLAAGSASPSG